MKLSIYWAYSKSEGRFVKNHRKSNYGKKYILYNICVLEKIVYFHKKKQARFLCNIPRLEKCTNLKKSTFYNFSLFFKSPKFPPVPPYFPPTFFKMGRAQRPTSREPFVNVQDPDLSVSGLATLLFTLKKPTFTCVY